MKACPERNRTALVTGATGCVGRNIVDELLAHGWDITVAHRKSSDVSRLKNLNVTLRETDLHDAESVLSTVPEGLDAIFHAAANVSHWPLEADIQWKDNVLATRNLVNAVRVRRVKRFIFTSTAATYEHAHKTPAEASKIMCDYARTKLLSEFEVKEGLSSGIDAVIIRPKIVMGKYDYNNYSQIFRRLREGKFVVTLPGIIEFNHARDVATAHRMAFDHGKTGEAYTLFGFRADWYEIYCRIARIMQVEPPARRTPLWFLYALAYPMLAFSYLSRRKPLLSPQLINLLAFDPETTAFEKEKTSRDLGYRAAALDEILTDSYQWLAAEGMIKISSATSMTSRAVHPADSASNSIATEA